MIQLQWLADHAKTLHPETTSPFRFALTGTLTSNCRNLLTQGLTGSFQLLPAPYCPNRLPLLRGEA